MFVIGLIAAVGMLILAQDAQKTISFDVASVKLNKADGPPNANFPLGPGDVYVTNGGHFIASGFPLTTYLFFAYKIQGNDAAGVSAQLPAWAATDHFDIDARTDGDPAKDAKDQMRLMMRSLLADRFKLATHYETKQVQVFGVSLVKAGKTGPQLQAHSEADAPCTTVMSPSDAPTQSQLQPVKGGFPPLCGGTLGMPPSMPGRVRVGARNITMAFLAQQLTAIGQLGRPVIDQTGLTGKFDFVLEWVPETVGNLPVFGTEFEKDPNGPSFDQAVKEQLGLKLESQKGENQVLMIDHLEHPSEN